MTPFPGTPLVRRLPELPRSKRPSAPSDPRRRGRPLSRPVAPGHGPIRAGRAHDAAA